MNSETEQSTEPEGEKPVSEKGSAQLGGSTPLRRLRVWPVVVLLALMLMLRVSTQFITNGPAHLWMLSSFGPTLVGILVLIWWLTFSRASGKEKIIGLLGLVACVFVAVMLADESMKGPPSVVMTVPMTIAAFGLGSLLFSRMLTFKRTILMLILAALGAGVTDVVRNLHGFWGDFTMDLTWRWEPSPEEKMLAEKSGQQAIGIGELGAEEVDEWLANPEWASFRGGVSSRQVGTKILTDWTSNKPKELWKIPVGPGWASFSVAGKLLFTMEQRDDEETVVCYSAESGEEVWTHVTPGRFEDTLGGPGPRCTPTLANGSLYVFGAKGILKKLDPKTGSVIWEHDILKTSGRSRPPEWGFCSSPLVHENSVIVHAGGVGDKGVIALDASSGDVKWSAASGNHSYSSPELCTLLEKPYVVMLSNAGMNLLDPLSGESVLDYEWPHSGYRALQPQVVDGDSILIPTGMGSGTRLVRFDESAGSLKATETWTSLDMKPDFNDLLVYEGHAYGFDNTIFASIDLKTGERNWKRGRYGKGQAILLEDSGVILVSTEKGDLALVKADPEKFVELARIPALEGKTWNHPVVAGDKLFMRNSQEAICFRLPCEP